MKHDFDLLDKAYGITVVCEFAQDLAVPRELGGNLFCHFCGKNHWKGLI